MEDNRPNNELTDIDQTLSLSQQLDGNVLSNPISDPFDTYPNKEKNGKKKRKER